MYNRNLLAPVRSARDTTKSNPRPLATGKTKHYEKNIDTINWNFDHIM
jgi:hypothetical protein